MLKDLQASLKARKMVRNLFDKLEQMTDGKGITKIKSVYKRANFAESN